MPPTIENVRYLLQRYGITVRYNVLKKRSEIQLPNLGSTADNAENVALTHIISLAALNGMPVAQVPSYVEALADQHTYNPVALWISSKPWDGKDRIPELVATVHTREDFPQGLKHTLLYRWLLSCVAAALKPTGFKARGVLTLQGPQSCGKTSWITALVSDAALRSTVIKLDHHLDAHNKDSIFTAIEHWIVEIGELDSSFKKDIARLKGFLTADEDKHRRPYARSDSAYPRRTVFAATVNEHSFLIDLTGNTRWWTLPVTALNYQHDVDMQQLFAQLAVDFQRGEQWWLTASEEELLETNNRDHVSTSAIYERLMERIDLTRLNAPDNKRMAAIEVLTWLEFRTITNAQCKECAAILRNLLGEPKKSGGLLKWRIPEKVEPSKYGRPITPSHPDHMY